MGDLSLRPATAADAAVLLRWRNDASTRAASRNTGEVSPREHSAWLAGVLASAERDLLIAERDGAPVGQLRFDVVSEAEVEISVGLDPAARGTGLGTRAISAGVEWLWRARPGAQRLIAHVRENNEPSLRAFTRSGFTTEGPAPEPGFRRLTAERP